MMLDFKCIVSPYNLYVHEANWLSDGKLDEATTSRLEKSISVLVELTERLKGRSYRSSWEI